MQFLLESHSPFALSAGDLPDHDVDCPVTEYPRKLTFEQRPQQRHRPGLALSDGLRGLELQALPRFDDMPIRVEQVEVINKRIAAPRTFDRVHGARTARGLEDVDVFDGYGQDDLVRNTGLNRVQRGVAHAGVAQQALARQIGCEPVVRVRAGQVGGTFARAQAAITFDALETTRLEEMFAIEVLSGRQGKMFTRTAAACCRTCGNKLPRSLLR